MTSPSGSGQAARARGSLPPAPRWERSFRLGENASSGLLAGSAMVGSSRAQWTGRRGRPRIKLTDQFKWLRFRHDSASRMPCSRILPQCSCDFSAAGYQNRTRITGHEADRPCHTCRRSSQNRRCMGARQEDPPRQTSARTGAYTSGSSRGGSVSQHRHDLLDEALGGT